MTPSPTPPSTSSPTGSLTAIGEVMKNKWVAAVVGLLIAIAVTLNTMQLGGAAAFPKWLLITANIVLGVAMILNLYTPGARGAANLVVLAIAGTLLFSSSCATMSSAEKSQLLNCGEQSVASAATTYAPQVGSILAGQSQNWNADLGDLLVVGGEAAFCALEVVIGNLEQGHTLVADVGGAGAGPPGSTAPIAVQLQRAYAVKVKAGYRVKR